ncbi:Uncharacterised protein [Bordetella ansorpii]|uniref:Uncharacterized protein n=1 Tax=Bordetella ansorpii TaxID=288768 RepID=A0A157SGZ1_9BORD|nr:hypothetical protein [Bordetella ansorpii]SAI69463.1 Uncharacterised protein [Bordetella ansorpii]
MRTITGAILGTMLVVAGHAQAGTAEQSQWSDTRAPLSGLPCAGAAQARATPVSDSMDPGQGPHVYDTLERLVESGQIMNLRHTMTGADLWLAEPPGKRCSPGTASRRGKCSS